MAGAFELMAKTSDFNQLSRTMAETAAQLAKGKAEVEKQRRKSEEEAMAKIDDFYVKNKNVFTQKYLPFAQQAYKDAIEKVAEDKAKYPNTWTNMVGKRILEMESGMLWAAEQSSTQMKIEKSAQEGYMVPKPLLEAYKSNYGDLSDIQELSPVLSDYNINVSENGAISALLVKPADLMDEFSKFKNNRALFMEPTLEYESKVSPDGTKFDITKKRAAMDPASVAVFTRETVDNPGIRVSYMTSPQKKVEIAAQMDALSKTPGFDKIDPAQLKEIALTRVIQADIDKLEKDRVDIDSQRKPKEGGINIYTGDRPQYINPDNVLYEETYTIPSGSSVGTIKPGNPSYSSYDAKIKSGNGIYTEDTANGKYIYERDSSGNIQKYGMSPIKVTGFNAEAVWEKQSDKEKFAGVSADIIADKKLYDPITLTAMGSTAKNKIASIFSSGTITDYLYIGNKVFAKIKFEMPPAPGVSKPGVNSFIIQVERNDKLDNNGKNLASTESEKYNSMYDYFSKKAKSTDPWDAATY